MYRFLFLIVLMYTQNVSAQGWYMIQDKYVINRSDPFKARLDSGTLVHPLKQLKTQDIHSFKWYNLVGTQNLLPLLNDTSSIIIQDKANVAGLQLLCMEISAPAQNLVPAEFMRRLKAYPFPTSHIKGTNNQQWQERYCLKSLSQAGSASGSLFLREVSQPLELVLFDNPYPACLSKKINLSVHFHQQAIPNSIIHIYYLKDSKWKNSGQIITNVSGTAVFETREPGIYRLTTQKLVEPTTKDEAWAAWNSCLTFEVR